LSPNHGYLAVGVAPSSGVGIFKYTLFAMALGAILLVGILVWFYLPQAWGPSQMKVDIGSGGVTENGLNVTLNGDGVAIVLLSKRGLTLENYDALRVSLETEGEEASVRLFWNVQGGGSQPFMMARRTPSAQANWIGLSGARDWRGYASLLGVAIYGAANQKVILRQIQLFPASWAYQIKGIFREWTSFQPWSRKSINMYAGIDKPEEQLYPAPTFALFMGLSLISWYLLAFFFPLGKSSPWRVAAMIGLLCWITLDLFWQYRLLGQLESSYQQFAGKTSEQRLAATADAQLITFLNRVKSSIKQRGGARLFLASADDYRGMRASYHLYPGNVFWRRFGPELPEKEVFQSGDYIVLINPSKVLFRRDTNKLVNPQGEELDARMILEGRDGSLLKVP
jgi:hypothetical protein